MHIQLLGLNKIPLLKHDDDLSELILESAQIQDITIENGDILVIAETAISKIEGNFIDLKSIIPSQKAEDLALKTGKDPQLVEAILDQSNEIVKVGHDFIVCETRHGFVCANAGIDESNVSEGMATPMPTNPDASAKSIKEKITEKTGKEIAVIISDTQGRPFRDGAVGVAVGVSGIKAIWDRKGEIDLYGRKLQTTKIAVADELAASASLIMGQADEGIPVVIVRGYNSFELLKEDSKERSNGIKSLIRPKKFDAFR
ncbi:coenzyme F420-0:L-glutamate ligase [Methanobacterium alcaliphilum]|uniref:coenzyme F420-0:L-glutamate ligase n=1 Tax=Methanobacterium alcaliphilum TaxID=392018 RepID=UPI00200B7FA7|nr:coenzyme F420-0:L-glutamate ligase [Methanobacterium alcaliphilum]MCK9150381.1 coenzyme F420-0:L-glutamate ligase [Methanobacterium alcaliphilum]